METNAPAVSYRESLQQHVKNGRRTLLGVILMTVLNVGLLLANSDSYFLFSASVPYYLTALGKAMDSGSNGIYTGTGLAISAVILGVYLLLWVLSKKHGNLLWAAAVLVALDLVCLVALFVGLFGDLTGAIVDILFHVVAIYQIGKGAASWKKFLQQPPEISYTVITEDL